MVCEQVILEELTASGVFFQHAPDQILSRAWLIDPGETQANVATTTKTKGEKEPWNGEFYVSFGGELRS